MKEENKLAILGHIHFGWGKGIELHENLRKVDAFFENVFFPSIDSQGIDKLLILGDIIDYYDRYENYPIDCILEHLDNFCSRVGRLGIESFAVAGYHDCVKGANQIYRPLKEILLANGIHVVESEPQSHNLVGCEAMLLPYNEEIEIQASDAKLLFGYNPLEFNHPVSVDMISTVLPKLELFISGKLHEHKFVPPKSLYLAAPCIYPSSKLYFSDDGVLLGVYMTSKPGFYILTNAGSWEIEFIENPDPIYVKSNRKKEVRRILSFELASLHAGKHLHLKLGKQMSEAEFEKEFNQSL